MSEQNNGGPAFPSKKRNISTGEYLPVDGMTLRDYFAAQALVGILACFRDYNGASCVETRSEKAYEYADAMLKARG